MAKVTNITASRPLSICRVMVMPGECKSVDASESDLRKHIFYQEGWLIIGDDTPKRKPGPKPKAEESGESESSEQ